MTVDPQTLHSEVFDEIGQLLQERATVLVERWCHRALEEQPHAARVYQNVLRDKLVGLLVAFGQSLAECGDAEAANLHVIALEHGEQRWDAGWSIAELVRDYQILRLVVIDDLQEMLERPLTTREVMAIGLGIDEAIGVSVSMYAAYREDQSRQAAKEAVDHEHRVAAALREHAEALQDAQRRKDDFLATLAHELRNPLSPILHAVEVMRQTEMLDPRMVQSREVIDRQARHMSRLLEDLLDLTRIAQSKLVLRKTWTDLGMVLQQARQVCQTNIIEKCQHLEIELPSPALWLECDADRLVQIVCNLLNNAAKYTPPEGRIVVSARQEGEQITISVRDTGIGIPSDMLNQVFELYRQVDPAQADGKGGLGVGLSLVRRLVEMHGGRVTAHSGGLGQGCEFVVQLPVGEHAEQLLSAAPATSVRPPERKSILLVEDNADARFLLGMLLEMAGHTVHTASDGPEAIAALRAHRPDVALLDIGLPGQNGYEVAKAMRQLPESEDLMLIAVTGYGRPEDRRRALDAGFDEHLVKPVKLDDLNRLLLEHGSNRARPAS